MKSLRFLVLLLSLFGTSVAAKNSGVAASSLSIASTSLERAKSVFLRGSSAAILPPSAAAASSAAVSDKRHAPESRGDRSHPHPRRRERRARRSLQNNGDDDGAFNFNNNGGGNGDFDGDVAEVAGPLVIVGMLAFLAGLFACAGFFSRHRAGGQRGASAYNEWAATKTALASDLSEKRAREAAGLQLVPVGPARPEAPPVANPTPYTAIPTEEIRREGAIEHQEVYSSPVAHGSVPLDGNAPGHRSAVNSMTHASEIDSNRNTLSSQKDFAAPHPADLNVIE